MKSFGFSILVILVFSTCKKPQFDGVNCSNNCIILEGKILEMSSGKGVAYVTVRLNASRNTGLGSSNKHIASVVTASDGSYSLKFDGSTYIDDYYRLKLVLNNDNYVSHYTLNETPILLGYVNIDSSNYGVPIIADYSVAKKGILHFNVKTPQTTDIKYINLSYSFGGTTFTTVLNGKSNMDTIVRVNTAANTPNLVSWSTTGGTNSSGMDSVIVSEFTPYQYHIDL